TRFMALQLGTSHYFNPQKARQELGYYPLVGMQEGLKRLQQLQMDNCQKFLTNK
ncbi:MAG: 3-beta hydroxysteroid dehydrogenase, partial [Oligoflexia bacterium]|nr:3-beta hydroxysteroid dehydrogenase [Oligoflexia bacterium]